MKKFFLTEKNILIAIIINSIVIFLMYFPDMAYGKWFEHIDTFFILFFLLEAIVKLRHYGVKGYFAEKWNVFDFVLVVGALPSLLMAFVPLPDTSLLIAFRIFRLVRIMRFLRFVPNMGHVLKGLARALKASVFIFLALIILNFFLSIVSCHFYAKVAPEYFGNPLLSAYSVFQLFTVEGWNEIPATIVTRLDNSLYEWLTRGYFVFVVLTGGIMGMSLANAVFVDEMTMDNNAMLEEKVDKLQEQISELTTLLKEKNEH